MRRGSILEDRRVREAWQGVGQYAQAVSGSAYLLKNSLNGGELAPEMAGRFDQARYQSGCHLLLNMVPLPCGGVTKRPGFQQLGWSAQASDAYDARLVPFIFSASEARMLEFTEHANNIVSMRVWTSGGTNLGAKLTLPWGHGVLATVSFCQSADVLFCASPHFRPAKIMRYGDNDWRYATINWLPQIGSPQITQLVATGSADGTKSWHAYRVTAIDEDGNESVAGPVRKLATQSLSSSHTIAITVGAVEGAVEYRIYKQRAGVYGFIGRTDAASGLTFTDNNIEPDTEDTPPEHRDPFVGAGNYPSVVFMHQQRLGYAASANRPLTVWLSQSGNFESMAASVPPGDDDAIEATLAAPEANRILWAQSDRNGLALGTAGAEWLLTSSEGAAITPADLSFQPQTYFGSEPGLSVLRAGSVLLYPQRGGQALREFGYSFADDRYQSTDLSLLARHILRGNPIVAWAWQPDPYGIAWCCLYNGDLAGLTYLKEHDVIAWHRHQTDGFIETIATLPNISGGWDLWALIFRSNNGQDQRSVERLAPFYEGSGAPCHTDGPSQSSFAARVIPCLPEIQTDAGLTLGMARKINNIKIRVLNSKPFTARITNQLGKSTAVQNVPPRPTSQASLADWPCIIAAGWQEGSRLELILDGPNPATILAISCCVEFADSLS